MSRNISNNVTSALESEELTIRMLLEVKLLKDDIPNLTFDIVGTYFDVEGDYVVFRFVANDVQDLTIPATCVDSNYSGKTYISAEIVRDNIQTSTDGQVEKTTIKISNKWQTWAAVFANLGNIMNNRPCRILEYFPDYPTEAPIVTFDGVINGVKMTASQFEWEIRRSMVDFNINSPTTTYDVNCQWQFRDERCKCTYYLYNVYKCDKTYKMCQNFGNVANYGGHLSVPRAMVIVSY